MFHSCVHRVHVHVHVFTLATPRGESIDTINVTISV